MASLQYINSKLSDAIYTLTIHEGDACTRLARICHVLNRLSISSFPKELQSEYQWVLEMIKKGNKAPLCGVLPHRLTGIQNRTASEVIQKILYIKNKIGLLVENRNKTKIG